MWFDSDVITSNRTNAPGAADESDAQLLVRDLDIDKTSAVYGVTQVDSRLYVVCADSGVITVFEHNDNFRQLDQITVEGLWEPADIVGCDRTQRLFVADRSEKKVFEVNANSPYEVAIFVEVLYEPWTMSLFDNRLLIVPFNGLNLNIYDISASSHFSPESRNPQHMVFLTKDQNARHAVETERGIYVVCGNKEEGERQQYVVEVNLGGQMGERYSDETHVLRDIQHITLHRDGIFLVADGDSNAVIVLNERLEYVTVAICVAPQKPHRLHYNALTKHLIVGMKEGGVSVYNIDRCLR